MEFLYGWMDKLLNKVIRTNSMHNVNLMNNINNTINQRRSSEHNPSNSVPYHNSMENVNIGLKADIPQDLKNYSLNSERMAYKDKHQVNVYIGGELIGCATWHNRYKPDMPQLSNRNNLVLSYWCGYCRVNGKWHSDVINGIITPDNIPEITYYNKSGVLGWHYAHQKNSFYHTNLGYVIDDICSMWIESHNYVIKDSSNPQNPQNSQNSQNPQNPCFINKRVSVGMSYVIPENNYGGI